jgi:hypothetical protein
MSSAESCIVACVVDDHPRFHLELILWTLCSTRYLPAQTRRQVWFIDHAPGDLLDWVGAQGVAVKHAATLLPGSPHCNKILPFLQMADKAPVVVTDADLYFVDDPMGFLSGKRFRAAPNNHANPPPRIWRNVLTRTGLGRPYRPGLALFPGQGGLRETHVNNISAGVVYAPPGRAQDFAGRWLHWARWLVENRDMMEAWHVHVDQMAFALALEEKGEDVDFLPAQMNTVLHLFDQIETPLAFHLTTGHVPAFASRFLPDHTLSLDGLNQGLAERVNRLNQCIGDAVTIAAGLPSTRDHLDKFLNPAWRR